MPPYLLELPPSGGHGKVWHRVLNALRDQVSLIPLGSGTDGSEADVVLADGHSQLAPAEAPLVVQVHEASWFKPDVRETLDPDFFDFIVAHTEATVRAAVRVITPSESARRDVLELYDLEPSRVHAVPHGVDPVFGPDARGGRALVAEARHGRDAPYVLHVAALHPRKNLGALREAMTRLAAEGFPHVLVAAGSPAVDRPDSSELERAASAELTGAPGRMVRMKDPTDAELASLMAEADAFCLPSLYEGFGLTALEAMACGTPVVVSDRGSLPEVVGQAGLTVPPTAEGITSALRRLLLEPDLAKRLGSAGAERAQAFSWKRTAAGWFGILRAAASRN